MNNAYQKIKTTVIVGGTHGNELSGVQALLNWRNEKDCHLYKIAPSTNLHLELANQASINSRTRYIDEDLNRQFTKENLSNSALPVSDSRLPNEAQIAKDFNAKYGPKFSDEFVYDQLGSKQSKNTDNHQSTRVDFVIDIHNTTSNMGPTLIILVNDGFHQQLARFVKKHMPSANILVEDYQDFNEFGYLCTVGKRGVMIEVGPQAQNTLRADVYAQTQEMTEVILRYIELYNTHSLTELEPVEAYRLIEEVAYPSADGKTKSAMIHPSLYANDFALLQTGQPCFITFSGEDILWQKQDTYPHFIGEAAYDHLNLAFATANKVLF